MTSGMAPGETFRLELPAGESQMIVLYVNQDTAEQVEPGSLAHQLAQDAARLRAEGWELGSVASMPLRQMGTAGNVVFQSGGQFATQVALIALYKRAEGAG
jgi:hypothetical protein